MAEIEDEATRRTLFASQNQPQMHLEPVHAGILAGMSKDVIFCWTPAGRRERERARELGRSRAQRVVGNSHWCWTLKTARLSIVTFEMSSTSAMASAQPETRDVSMLAAPGSPACEVVAGGQPLHFQLVGRSSLHTHGRHRHCPGSWIRDG